jgi:hypothetical protein
MAWGIMKIWMGSLDTIKGKIPNFLKVKTILGLIGSGRNR